MHPRHMTKKIQLCLELFEHAFAYGACNVAWIAPVFNSHSRATLSPSNILGLGVHDTLYLLLCTCCCVPVVVYLLLCTCCCVPVAVYPSLYLLLYSFNTCSNLSSRYVDFVLVVAGQTNDMLHPIWWTWYAIVMLLFNLAKGAALAASRIVYMIFLNFGQFAIIDKTSFPAGTEGMDPAYSGCVFPAPFLWGGIIELKSGGV